jgi:hypothetical protein
MPLCDWSKVNPALYHHFHQRWIAEITDSLNAGHLPTDLFALVQPFANGSYPLSEVEGYAAKANKIVIRHVLGDVVAALEIVSPGNKSSQMAFRDFIDKTVHCIRNGVHVLVIDPFPHPSATRKASTKKSGNSSTTLSSSSPRTNRLPLLPMPPATPKKFAFSIAHVPAHFVEPAFFLGTLK